MSDFFDDVFTAYCNSYNECASCPLGKETGDCRDLFARKMEAWAAKQVEMAAAETTTPATDTNLPRSAKRSVGEDINVPTTLPKWVKVGQWVEFSFARDDRPYKILREKHGEVYISNMADDERAVYYGECKPVRFRSYSFEEAKGLIGKTMECSCDEGPFSERTKQLLLITVVSNGKYGVLINGDSFTTHSELFNATIDGIPIGMPEVDEDALKEVE